MTVRDWVSITSLLATFLVPLLIALIRHIKHDERRDVRLENIEKEIGTRDTGLRGSVHKHTNTITWMSGCLWFLASKVGIELPKRDK